MKPLGLTVIEAARRLGVSRKALSADVGRRSGVSAETALRIARATNTSGENRLKMQPKLDLWEVRRLGPRIAGEFVRV